MFYQNIAANSRNNPSPSTNFTTYELFVPDSIHNFSGHPVGKGDQHTFCDSSYQTISENLTTIRLYFMLTEKFANINRSCVFKVE